MNNTNQRTSCVAAVAIAALTAFPASATVYSYAGTDIDDISAPVEGIGAEIHTVNTTYDDVTERFTWDVVFNPGPGGAQPNGFTLVVNDGPMPKGHTGELAALYFDATGAHQAAPIVTAYAYNGADSATSFRHSDFHDVVADAQNAPDTIISSLNDASFIETAQVIDNADGTRTMRLAIDASAINAHSPSEASIDQLNGDAPLSWLGLAFAQKMGVWFHPYNLARDTIYNDDGFLFEDTTNLAETGWWVASNYGTLDATDLDTTSSVVPEPASMLIAVGGLALLAGRRRRA
ncbi:MAG: PEP-CTERM sorting domain-containing protein [Algisphaera sp.]